MCGRFKLGISMEDILDFEEILRQVEANIKEHTLSPYLEEEKDFYPGSKVPLLTSEGLKIMHWGFPIEKKLVFNARAETLLEKNMFKEAAKKRRCLIPCTLFYEWKTTGKEKTKYEIDTNHHLFYLGGIYGKTIDPKGNLMDSFAIITKASQGDMVKIHHREPLVVPKHNLASFLKSTEEIQKEFLHYSSPEFIYHPIEGEKQLSLF
ncbi:MAG: SOS response-associated peptidase [Clostridium sp.]|nr:SOS response-associated peptidase [Clostridium sp.]